ncbi:MAG: hypothetical protein RLZZ312_1449 [Bacteroidota bacterium]
MQNQFVTDIVKIIDAYFVKKITLATVDNVSIDSRSMSNNASTIFFAIVGNNHNGHFFIKKLVANGVQNFVVQHIPEGLEKEANFLVVENSVTALQNFATFHRLQFQIPIIGITGSNGKTVVKEWLNFLLSPDHNIARSPKSYNSQVGVPLSVLTLNENHSLGIFEAGISTTNEMQNLQKVIQPTIGILTNIGSAHDEGFSDLAQKIKEKLRLFSDVKILIYNLNKTIASFLSPKTKTFTWSNTNKRADVFVQRIPFETSTKLKIEYQNIFFDIKIPFTDDAAVENSMQCISTMLYLKYDFETIENRVSKLFPIEMRLKVKAGKNNTTIIDDSYSSDFQSLKIALDFLENQKQFKKKTLILSDINQSGLNENELYSKVSQLILANKISRVIIIGQTISKYRTKYPNATAFENTNDFLKKCDLNNFSNETILIKGARSFEFEKIVTAFEQKNHETVLEINLNAISHNLNFYRAKLQKGVKTMVMVKAFGYGNGGLEIAQLLQHHNVDYLGVAFADEGIALRQGGITMPIMVLNPEISSFSAIIENNLEPEIYSIKGLESFLKIAKENHLSRYSIHIKIDTGMHRLGFENDNLDHLVKILKNEKRIKIKSILSHLATSDDVADTTFAQAQINKFIKISNFLKINLELQNPILHVLNSSGISNFPDSQFDMVRLGIGLYGISNNPKEQPFLQNVSTLKSVVSQIRIIPAGDSVGYSRKFIAINETKIATIPIGYADGVTRLWGNQNGFVVINNQKATIVGNICMDMLMVNVTDITCSEGDKVIIFGENPTVQEIAAKTQTIAYEVLTNVSQRVKRVFYRE